MHVQRAFTRIGLVKDSVARHVSDSAARLVSAPLSWHIVGGEWSPVHQGVATVPSQYAMAPGMGLATGAQMVEENSCHR